MASFETEQWRDRVSAMSGAVSDMEHVRMVESFSPAFQAEFRAMVARAQAEHYAVWEQSPRRSPDVV